MAVENTSEALDTRRIIAISYGVDGKYSERMFTRGVDGYWYSGTVRFCRSGLKNFSLSDDAETLFCPIPDDEEISRWVLADGTVFTSVDNSRILNPEAVRIALFDGTVAVVPTGRLDYVQDLRNC